MTGEHDGGGADVLLLEPDPRDARLVHCGLQRQSVTVDVAPDGRTAIERLTAGSDQRTDDELPELVVLDLCDGEVTGETVLHAIRASPRLRTLPVVTLTDAESSDRAEMVDPHGTNAHLSKPADAGDYADMIESMAVFWFGHAELPPVPHTPNLVE